MGLSVWAISLAHLQYQYAILWEGCFSSSDFNTYLLYNLELFLKKNNYKGWSSYKLSVKKFYTGEVCEDYGKKCKKNWKDIK